MFDDQNQNSAAQPQADMPIPEPAAVDTASSAPSAPTIPDPIVTPTNATSPAASGQPEPGINGVTMEDASIEPAPQIGPAKPAKPETVPTAASMISSTPASEPPIVDQGLASIKQQALQSLEPLVDRLEMAPEDKFKTLMMVIQASDKSEMLEKAYQSASQITDEKTRAQALLDVVNEVNYFSQKSRQT